MVSSLLPVHIEDNTCLKIEPRDTASDTDFVFVRSERDDANRGKCNAQVGYFGTTGEHRMHLGEL